MIFNFAQVSEFSDSEQRSGAFVSVADLAADQIKEESLNSRILTRLEVSVARGRI